MNQIFAVYIGSCVINYFSMHTYFSALSNRNIKLSYKKIIAIIVCFLLDISVFYYSDYVAGWFTSVMAIVIQLCIGYLHEKRIVRCLLLTAGLIVLQSVCETISVLLTALFFRDSIYVSTSKMDRYMVSMMLFQMIFLIVSLMMFLYFKEKNVFVQRTGFWRIVVSMAVGSVYIIYYVSLKTLNNNDRDYVSYLICIMTICIMNIIVFIFYDQICSSHQLKEERDGLLHYVELQQSEQSKVDIYNKKIIKIRHDMKNYVLGIESLIKNEHYAEALTELGNISQNVIKTPAVISTIDSVVNHILNAKMWNMNQENITFERRINIEKEIPINAGDMSVMLGNALDNAIEYVMTHKNVSQAIRLDMMYQGNVFVVKVRNQVEEDILIPKDMILKTTKESGGHGVGMKSVKEICSRYNGTFVVTCKDKVFMEEIRMILNGEYDVKGSGM